VKVDSELIAEATQLVELRDIAVLPNLRRREPG
jgi:hypothetical protein